MSEEKRVTNKEFSQKNPEFINACWDIERKTGKDAPRTARQASKFRRKTGLVWNSIKKNK